MSRTVTINLNSVPAFDSFAVGDTVRLTVKQGDKKVNKVYAEIPFAQATSDGGVIATLKVSEADAQRVYSGLDVSAPVILNVKRRNGAKVNFKGVEVTSIQY